MTRGRKCVWLTGKQVNPLFCFCFCFYKSGLALARVEDTKLHDKVCEGKEFYFSGKRVMREKEGKSSVLLILG